METSHPRRLPAKGETGDGLTGLRLPFGYRLERDADLLIVRRSDGSFLAAFNAGVDPFEVEWAVWEDAD
jgi:hypothetical protein